jgi:threonine synthase
MWKAFEEMEQLGWVAPGPRPQLKKPKMIAVQSSGCAPVARAFEQGKPASEAWQDAATFAAGLRVPKPYGDTIILDICRSSGGVCLAIPDDIIFQSLLDWSRNEGILLSPEGAAATAAYDHLLASGYLKSTDRCVLFNTGAGLKYADVIAEKLGIAAA